MLFTNFGLVGIATVVSLLGLVFAGFLIAWIMRKNPGNAKVREVTRAIQTGSNAFVKRQYRTIALLSIVVAAIIWFGLGPMTSIAFMIGALCSAVAGIVSMYVAVRANGRTTQAATKSITEALDVSFKGGAVMGLFVVAMSLLGICVLFLIPGFMGTSESTSPIIGLAFGASFVALFAQLGGGIYTKAADIGADLVGKVEANIPEDDPRNPAVIADNVGDAVGDCAGRGADLFESCIAENIGAMLIGLLIVGVYPFAVVFPLVARAFGIFASIIGMQFVKARPDEDDPMRPMRFGLYITSAICAVGFFFLIKWLLGGNMWLFACSIVGIVSGLLLEMITDHYTSTKKKPVQDIAKASQTGAATNFLSGFGYALECTALPILVMCAAILSSYYLGRLALPDSGISGGIYGTAIATIGILSTAVYILSMDGFGPIADNAAGIAEMSGLGGNARKVLDPLDAVGNTTKSLTKGYAMGSAALSAFLVVYAYFTAAGVKVVDLALPKIFVAGFIGIALPFLFAAFAIRAVGNAAQDMVTEVRRQFREIKGILKGKAKPDYEKCVDISTKAALKEMVVPGLLVVIVPIAVGLIFGPAAVGAFLLCATMSGIALAMLMNTGGAAWDNAKKYIEDDHLGGKGSETHAAAVSGDMVGDPFKDTAGPSLHVLIKLINTLCLVFAPLFVWVATNYPLLPK